MTRIKRRPVKVVVDTRRGYRVYNTAGRYLLAKNAAELFDIGQAIAQTVGEVSNDA